MPREPKSLRKPRSGKLAGLAELLSEYYNAPFRGAVARAKRHQDDLFMLLVFSEMVGIPNPASYFTLELQPLLYQDFHAWHKRMGMEHSPLEWFTCC